MNYFNQKAVAKNAQINLFDVFEVTSSDRSVSNEKMKELEEKYNLVPTNEFQGAVADIFFAIKDGDSITHAYAKKFGIDNQIVDRLLSACEEVLNGSSTASLCGCIDFVLWGEDCDVALIAFYEVSIKTIDPAIWTRLEGLTFVCDDKSVLDRCKLIAEMLFPNVKDPVGIVCGTAEFQKIRKLQFGYARFMIPRVHIVTSGKAYSGYFDAVKCAITDKACNRIGFDDYFLFVNWNSDMVRENCERVFGEYYKECRILTTGCAYGKVISDRQADALRQYSLLRDIVELSQHQNRNENCQIDGLIRCIVDMNDSFIPGERFLDVYKNVQWMDSDVLTADCLVFYPDVSVQKKVLILKLSPFSEKVNDRGMRRDDEMTIAEKWMRECWRKTENSAVDAAVRNFDGARRNSVPWAVAFNDIRKFVMVMSWNPGGGVQISHSVWNRARCAGLSWNLENDVNLGDMYGVEFKGVSQLQKPDAEQKKVVYDRRQYRKVRGGPGTGKTLTMLWHAAQVIENKHLPVLILGKTNTLTGRNLKKFAATYCTQKNCTAEALRRQVEFSTVALYVCGNAKIMNGKCLSSRCANCVLMANRSGKQKSFEEKLQLAMTKCVDCNTEYCIARQLLEEGTHTVTESHRQKCCDACKKSFYSSLLSGEADLAPLKDSPAYGAVMIDEGQAIPCEELQACYLITAAANRWREFYMFCDEEQHFRGGGLENDEGDATKKVVRAPARGFGKFVTLTRNHRAYSKKMLSVYNKIQGMMAKMYDIGTLTMVLPESAGKRNDFARVFNVQRGNASVFESVDAGFAEIAMLVESMKRETGSDTILVLCDDVDKLRDWNVKAKERNWIVTHLSSKEDRKEERRLRLRFGERPGFVHLTGTDCAQGQTFENVLFISTRENQIKKSGGIEELFTALTRARANLRVVDYSNSSWLYEMLKGFND